MDRFKCLRCSREFLSEYQLERHHVWNPEHREPIVLDAQELAENGETLPDSDWVEFDDRVETFLRVVDGVDIAALEFQYRPDTARVIVNGPHGGRQTIDVSEIQDRSSDNLKLSLDGTYLKLGFLKPE